VNSALNFNRFTPGQEHLVPLKTDTASPKRRQ